MRQKINNFLIAAFLIFGVHAFAFSQELSSSAKDEIRNEITKVFEKSIAAGEKLEVDSFSKEVDDSLKTGFIENGYYFKTFEELMVGFKARIRGLEYQELNVTAKKITVLSETKVLLTAHGDFSAKITDGRILNGKFAWTFVYSKIKGQWKVIHSHMSAPQQ